MRRVAIAATLALWVGVLAYGVMGSAAWFTDTEVIPVSASAANLGIQLESDGLLVDSEEGLAEISATFTEMEPGGSQPFFIVVTVRNTGDIPVKLLLDAEKTGGSLNIFNNIDLAVLDPDDCAAPAAWTVRFNDKLSGLSYVWPHTIPVGGETCMSFEFDLASTASDNGGETTFKLVFRAAQLADPSF